MGAADHINIVVQPPVVAGCVFKEFVRPALDVVACSPNNGRRRLCQGAGVRDQDLPPLDMSQSYGIGPLLRAGTSTSQTEYREWWRTICGDRHGWPASRWP